MANSSDGDTRYKLLFDLAADAILTGDSEGKITEANLKAEILCGYSQQELIGQRITILFSAEENRRAPLRFDLVNAGKEVQAERLLSRKDGSTVPISMNSKRMPDGSYHTTMRDITHQKNLEKSLKTINHEMEAFVYTVSHDLRTPLSTIIGFVDYLRNQYMETLDEAGQGVLDRIEQTGEGMLATMEALLSLATVGQPVRPEQPVDLTILVNEILEEKKKQLTETGISVRTTELPSLHVPETFLRQIFNNLVSNAIFYAGEDNDRIEIGGHLSHNRAVLYVRDYGSGIPEKDRHNIFDAFFRGATSGDTRGTGVGLAIVRKISRSYGGNAWLEETPGGGCTFRIELADVAPT